MKVSLEGFKSFMETHKIMLQNINQYSCKLCHWKPLLVEHANYFQCDHRFCIQCIQAHCNKKIMNYKIITCLQPKCKAEINQQGLKFLNMSQWQQKKYQKAKRLQYVQNNPKYKLCPKEQCVGMINTRIKSSFCNQCGQKYCPKCLYKKHRGKCENNSIKQLQNNFKFVQCMKCNYLIEKSHGDCDHILCKCGFQLCYKCGGQWDQYRHWCVRSKSFQKVRSKFLPIKKILKYQSKLIEKQRISIIQLIKKFFFFNILLGVFITLLQIPVRLVGTYNFICQLSLNYTGVAYEDVQKLLITQKQTIVNLAISLTLGYILAYLEGLLKEASRKGRFMSVILLTSIFYYFMPNLFCVYYYEVQIIDYFVDNFDHLIITLFGLFSAIKITHQQLPSLQQSLISLFQDIQSFLVNVIQITLFILSPHTKPKIYK